MVPRSFGVSQRGSARARLDERDMQLATACEIANRDDDVALTEGEFDQMNDEVLEP
jgi:hypothetical protein